jgi:hypothetical protein
MLIYNATCMGVEARSWGLRSEAEQSPMSVSEGRKARTIGQQILNCGKAPNPKKSPSAPKKSSKRKKRKILRVFKTLLNHSRRGYKIEESFFVALPQNILRRL